MRKLEILKSESFNNFLIPYNFRIKNEDLKIYRYFRNYDRLTSFLSNGIFMANANSFDDGLECGSKELIKEIKELYEFMDLRLEDNRHLTKEELESIIFEKKTPYKS